MSAEAASPTGRDHDESISPEPDDDALVISEEGGESEDPDSNGDDDDDHYQEDPSPPPPRKRRRCPSSAVLSASVKLRVREAASYECWLCGLNGRHVAHVVGKADIVLFESYKRQGLLHMPTIHAVDNLIFLCAGCHDGFDERVPVWAFLPVDLDAFITAEVAFQRARDAAAATGELLRRPAPSSVPELPYARYQIRPKFIFTHVFLDNPIKTWVGSPIAVILRSASIVSGQERLPVAIGGLPADVALKLQHLLYLYATPPPETQSVAPIPRPLRVVAATPESDRQGRNTPNRPITSSGPSQHPPAREARASEAGSLSDAVASGGKAAAARNAVRQRNARRRRRDAEHMAFGAHMTADMIRGWYVATRPSGTESSG